MPRYYRSRSRYGRRVRYGRWRSYRRYYRRRGYLPRTVNSTDSSSCPVKVITKQTSSCAVAAGLSSVYTVSTFGSTEGLSAYFNLCGVLSSGIYRVFADMYDEVKVRGVQYRIIVDSPVGSGEGPSDIVLYTSIDRRIGFSEDAPTSSMIQNVPSTSPYYITNFKTPEWKRYVRARDVIEKSQFHDCSYRLSAGSPPTYSDPAFTVAGENPNFFSPGLFFMLGTSDKAYSGAINVTVQCVYYLTFRNPVAPYI